MDIEMPMEERKRIGTMVVAWTSHAVHRNHYPIVMITMNASDPADIEIHKSGEYPVPLLCRFLRELLINLEKNNDARLED